MNKYKKAYDRMARYIENAEGCCPAASSYPLEKDNCLSCIGECIDRRNEGYSKELSVQCWKEIFMEDVTEQEFEKILKRLQGKDRKVYGHSLFNGMIFIWESPEGRGNIYAQKFKRSPHTSGHDTKTGGRVS